MSTSQNICIASAIITDEYGRCQLVRKRGTTHFIQPGGKMEPDEITVVALMRELQEELNFNLTGQDFSYVGRFTDKAINEPGRVVIAEIYHSVLTASDIQPAAEIEEVIWYPTDGSESLLLAPLTENHLMPLVAMLHQNYSESLREGDKGNESAMNVNSN
ncbi:NUDIX domain-containing protein [Cronobacter turicensis]|nr:NUDIX domain-containing protein [Cronobacter turicensis]ELY4384128.1 NUDIX domain-containing protein [Cronobacter turicensis]ELY6270405.1 NUDIX domain-containing protein [Cronobacter turicensis]